MRSVRSGMAVAMALGLLAVPTVGLGASPGPGSADHSVIPSAAPSQAPCPNPYGGGGTCLGPLAAGTYRTTTFRTPISYTVPDGWANFEDEPGNFLLVPPGGSIQGVDAGTSDYIGIYQGAAVAEANCEDGPEPGVGTTAAEMAAALRAREGLVVTEPVPVEVGGLSGLMIDIALDPGPGRGCNVPDYPGTLVPLTVGTGPASLHHAQIAGFTTRLYLLDHGLTNVVIEVSDVEDSPGTPADYEPVIAGLSFASE